jgi:hypothetical protein
LPRRKKTAEAIRTEIAREVTTLSGRIFAERKQTGGMDLEAVEMGFRASLHQAGRRLSLSCCSSPSLPPNSATFRAPAANTRITANCARDGLSPHWARWNCRAPGIYVRTVTAASL